MTDEELVSKIVNNNETKLFGILYDRFSKNIYNKCYSFVNNEEEAQDLTQDIFLKLFVKLSAFKGKSKFSTWVYSFTFNHCVNYKSRNPARKYERRLPEWFEIEDASQGEMTLSDDSVDKLNDALSKISTEDKSLLLLKYQDNLSIKNLENLLGIGSSAVKMRIKRARERFAFSYAS